MQPFWYTKGEGYWTNSWLAMNQRETSQKDKGRERRNANCTDGAWGDAYKAEHKLGEHYRIIEGLGLEGTLKMT